MAQYDGSIRINTEINSSGLRQGENNIRSSMDRISNSAKKLAGIIGAAFIGGKIAQLGKEALDAGSDFEAMESQFSQVFGDLESVANESLSKVAGQAKIMENRMKGSFTKIAAFAKTTGMDTESSLKLSERAMFAVADSAAWYDRSLEETTEYLQSFLKGNYENDAALGLSATEFTRNAAANKLYGKSFIELSEAQKQLTLLTMVEDANRLSGALGQAARESDTWTNQIGNLKQAWTNLMASIGKIILPVAIQAVKFITNVINSLVALISKLSVAAGAFRSFSELLTGKKSSGGSGAGNVASSGGMTETTDSYNSAADAAENLAGSTEKVAKATKDAQKAAEGYLSPLDEINKISKENNLSDPSAGGGSGIGGSGIGGAIENVDYGNLAEGETIIDRLGDSLNPVIEKIKELAGLFKNGFFEGFGDYKPRIEELKKDILSIGQSLKEIFTDPSVITAADNYVKQLSYTLGQITGSIASIGLTIAELFIGGIEKYLTQNIDRIKQYIISMFDIGTETTKIIGDFSVVFADIFSVFGGDTAQQIAGNLIGIFAEVGMLISENAAKLGRDILNMITQPIIDNKDKIKEALEGTLQAIEPFTSGLLEAVQKVRDAVTEIYDEHLKPLFDSIANGFSEILGKLLDGYNTYILPVLQGLGNKFKELMEGPFGETVDKVKGFIEKLIDYIKLFWEGTLKPFFSWIADNIMPILAPILQFIGEKVVNTISTIVKVIGDIAQALGGVIDFITGIFTGDWEKAWNGIKDFFSGIWNAITDKIRGKWEDIKSLVNNGITFVSEIISAAWDGVKSLTSWMWDSITTVLFGALEGIKSGASEIFEGIKNDISEKWELAKAVTALVWDSVSGYLSEKWGDLKTNASTTFGKIKDFVSDKWSNIKTATNEKWNAIKDKLSDTWSTLKSKSKDSAGNIKDKVTEAWEGLKSKAKSIWDGITGVIKTPINAIIGFINKMIDGIATGINSLIGMLNNLKIDIPDGVPFVGGMKIGFDIPTFDPPKIPLLATGAVIPPNKEFLAILGDQKHGTNIEAPEGLIRSIMREELGKQRDVSGKNITIRIPVILNGSQLFEAIIDEGKLRQAQNGMDPFRMA